ncbi:hypothetical protein ACFL39_01125 [Gemmatimonadota bacterium]
MVNMGIQFERDDNPLDVYQALSAADFWLWVSTRSIPLANETEKKVWRLRWQIYQLKAKMQVEIQDACRQLLGDSQKGVGGGDSVESGAPQ